MKAAINGVLHLSILDGWWPEAYNGHNGWAFPGTEDGDRDAGDAAAIYDLLEKEVIPLYYQVNDAGIPVDWVQKMKEAMRSIGPKFSARRMVKEYSQKFYQPALQAAGS
jgi:starch phosphorylase